MAKAVYTVQDLTDPDSPERIFSRSTFYRMKAEGKIKVRYIGRRQIVTHEERTALLDALPTEREAA